MAPQVTNANGQPVAQYGNTEKNFFKGTPGRPGVDGTKGLKYTVIVKDSGEIELYSRSDTNLPQVPGPATKTGTYSVDGTFTPSASANPEEKVYFSNRDTTKEIKNHAKIVVGKDLYDIKDEDGNPKYGQNQASYLKDSIVDGTTLDPEVLQSLGDQDTANTIDSQDIPDISASIEGQSRDSYGNYYYPNSIESNKQDIIKFTMKIPKGSKINQFGSSNLPTFERTYLKENIGTVTLPIQPIISDRNSVDWAGLQLNAIDAAVAGTSYRLAGAGSVTGMFNEAEETLRGIQKQFLENKNIKQGMQVYLAQEASGVQGLLSRAAGAVLNPNLELLFRGPQLRPFTFTFTLSPREKSEGEMTRNIIRFFKQGMSVKTTKNNIFLKSPHVFDIEYKTYDKNGNQITHPSINLIKTCALIDCSVEYTPDGSYMTFNDDQRTMTSYRITLQFSEIEPIYDTDYDDYPKENFIGF